MPVLLGVHEAGREAHTSHSCEVLPTMDLISEVVGVPVIGYTNLLRFNAETSVCLVPALMHRCTPWPSPSGWTAIPPTSPLSSSG